jgi:hypothetical protein
MKQLACCLLVSVAACGDSSSSRYDELAASMEGIYSVQTYTRNEAACAPGGDSQLGTDVFAVVARESVFGTKYLSVRSCGSIAECRAVLAGQGAGHDFTFAVYTPDDDGSLSGEGRSTGFGDGTTCREGEVTATTLTLAGGALRVEQQITIADDYPVDSEGFCSTDAAAAAAAGNSCSQLEVMTATFVEAL